MTTPQISDALRGPWMAVLADADGYVIDPDEVDEHNWVDVVVVRGTCLPSQRVSDEPRLPGTYQSGDVLYQHEDLIPGDDDVAARWEQAQAVAAALNALPGQPKEES